MIKAKQVTAVLISILVILGASAMGVSSARAVTRATPTTASVTLNGSEIAFDAYNINSNNYYKLRDLAYSLNSTTKKFEVDWISGANRIEMTTNKLYTEIGGEMAKGDGVARDALVNTNPITLDGKPVKVAGYTIGGYNYFKLRDIGSLLNFGVDWTGETQTITIDTSKGYTQEETSPSPEPSATPSPSTSPSADKPAPLPTSGDINAYENMPKYVNWLANNTEFKKASDVGAYYSPVEANTSTAYIAVGPDSSTFKGRVAIRMVFQAWGRVQYAEWDENDNVTFKSCDITGQTKELFACLLGDTDGLALYNSIEEVLSAEGSGWHSWDKTFTLHGRTIQVSSYNSGIMYVYVL